MTKKGDESMAMVLTEADEIELVHLIKNVVEKNVEHVENKDGYGQARQIRELIRRIQKIELIKGSPASTIPQGLRETMTYLMNESISDYLPALSENLDEDYREETALDEDFCLTPTLSTFMTEYDAHEQIQKHIIWLRDKIIALGENELYEICRFFFCAENTYDTRKKLIRKMTTAKIPASWHEDILQKFYVQTTSMEGTVDFCCYCGELMSDQHLHRSEVCRHFYQENGEQTVLSKTFKGSDALYRLDPQVVRSIVIPNLGEQRLRDRLLAHPKVLEVEMYPYFDSYDLKVRTATQTYWLDVKDYKMAGALVYYFKREQAQAKKLANPQREEVKASNVYLIVPKHRVQMSKRDYLTKLRAGLGKVQIKAKSEDEFIQQFLD